MPGKDEKYLLFSPAKCPRFLRLFEKMAQQNEISLQAPTVTAENGNQVNNSFPTVFFFAVKKKRTIKGFCSCPLSVAFSSNENVYSTGDWPHFFGRVVCFLL